MHFMWHTICLGFKRHWKNTFVHFNEPKSIPVTLVYMDSVLQPACLTINFYLQLTFAYDLFKASEKVAGEGISEAKAPSYNTAALNSL